MYWWGFLVGDWLGAGWKIFSGVGGGWVGCTHN